MLVLSNNILQYVHAQHSCILGLDTGWRCWRCFFIVAILATLLALNHSVSPFLCPLAKHPGLPHFFCTALEVAARMVSDFEMRHAANGLRMPPEEAMLDSASVTKCLSAWLMTELQKTCPGESGEPGEPCRSPFAPVGEHSFSVSAALAACHKTSQVLYSQAKS